MRSSLGRRFVEPVRTLETLQGAIHDARWGDARACFSQDAHRAEVRISYPDRREKDMRLQRIGLVREPDGAWKVADVYGKVRGGMSPPTEP